MHTYESYEPSRIPFLCGIEVAQRQDYTALVPMRPVNSALHVRYIHRFSRNTSYPRILDSMHSLLGDRRIAERTTLVAFLASILPAESMKYITTSA